MDISPKNKPFIKSKTLAELLPGIRSILSEDAVRSITKMQPRKTIAQSRTVEKVVKPLTIAEMRANIGSLLQSPKRNANPNTTSKKKIWNSSVKPENKMKSLTTNGQAKHSSVRKVLNFQPKTKPVPKLTLISSETPKFPKPEIKAKKSLNLQAKHTVRISGINKIPQAPQQTSSRTPLSNLSIKSSSDASFLQNEKRIHMEEKEAMLNVIPKIADKLPMSTPFKEYRNVQEYFDSSCNMDTSLNNNTILNNDKELISKENSKREDSVIVSLCDMLTAAAVTTTDEINTELNDLLEIEKQTENNIQKLEFGIQTLNNIKESQQKALENVKKLINEKRNPKIEMKRDPKLAPIKVVSPSYKIPRKNKCLRKKVLHKSMQNVSNGMETPIKSTEKVLNMYMEIKEQMNFLNTPSVKRHNDCSDTPSATSRNLHKQLDKLYNGS